MNYIIKNEFIKRANSIVKGGNYVPKWKHESMLERHDVDREIGEIQVIVDGHKYKVI